MTPPPGVRLVGGHTDLKPDPATQTGHLRITYTWDTPWSVDASGTHQLYWQKQPGVAQDSITVTWTSTGPTSTASSDLGTDRLVTLDGTAVHVGQGSAAQVALPRL
jgi:hypothetical protein